MHIEIPEGHKREKRIKILFEEIKGKNLPNLQYFMINHNGKEYEKRMYIYIYTYIYIYRERESYFALQQKLNTTL